MKCLKSQEGFTIIELMIAMGVFSMILSLTVGAAIGISNMYQRGLVSTQLQSASRNIFDEISRDVQFGHATPTITTSQYFGSVSVKAICIGTVRYTFTNDLEVSDTSDLVHGKNLHALWRDITNNTCAPADLTVNDPDTSGVTNAGILGSGKELVPLNTRLNTLSTPSSVPAFDVSLVTGTNNLYKIDVRLLYGDNGTFDSTTGNCLSVFNGGIFCSKSEAHSNVYERF